MNIQTLKYFLAVAREENFTRAADTLFITQPALSKQLKLLEEELGKKLFTRQNSGIKLTAEGILLKSRAENLVELADKIVEEFNSMIAAFLFWASVEERNCRVVRGKN